MKPLDKTIEGRGMKFVQIERTEDVALYAQFINDIKVAFEVFIIRKSQGYKFPNGLVTKPAEIYPKDNDFGKTAFSIGIYNDEKLSFARALGKFKELKTY